MKRKGATLAVRARRWAAAAGIAAAATIGMAFFTGLAPYNMDEFLFYDAILCHWFPGNDLHGSCDPFMLDALGTGWIAPLRSYHYVGSLPALYFFPLFLAFHSPLSARLLNVAMLAAGAWIAGRRFGLRARTSVGLSLLTFPYFFQHAVDTGPVSPQILATFAAYALIRRWIADGRTRDALCIGVIVFLSLWVKFSYFWLFPGLLVAVAVELHAQRRWDRCLTAGFWLQGAGAAAVATAGLAALLLSNAPGNAASFPYLDALKNSESFGVAELLGNAASSRAAWLLFHPLEATQRIFHVESHPLLSLAYSLLAYGFVPLSMLFLAWNDPGGSRRPKNGPRTAVPLLLYGAFLVTVLAIARTKAAVSMHHAILSYPFLLLSTFAAIEYAAANAKRIGARRLQRWAIAYGTAFACVNVALFCVFPFQGKYHHDEPEKMLAHAIVTSPRVSQAYTVVVLDWGMFYYSGLFGSPRGKSVVFEWGIHEATRLEELRSLAAAHGKKLLFLYTTRETAGDLGLIAGSGGLVGCAALPPASSAWAILAEPDDSLADACASFAEAPWLVTNPFARMLLTVF